MDIARIVFTIRTQLLTKLKSILKCYNFSIIMMSSFITFIVEQSADPEPSATDKKAVCSQPALDWMILNMPTVQHMVNR